VLVVLAAWLLMGMLAGPALAHAVLVHADPAPGAIVATPPVRLTLEFSEVVEVTADAVRVVRPDGAPLAKLRAGRDPASARRVITAVPDRLGPGTYTVAWQAISIDGHLVSGSFQFAVGTPSGPLSGNTAGTTRDGPSPVEALARALAVVGALAAAGVTAFPSLVLERVGAGLGDGWTALRRQLLGRVRRLAGASAGMAFVGSLMLLADTVGRASGRSLLGALLDGGGVLTVGFGTHTGRILLVRLLGLTLVAGLVASVRPRRPRRHANTSAVNGGPVAPVDGGTRPPASGWRLRSAGLAALAVLVTFSLASHAASVRTDAALAVGLDWVHLAAVAVWLGGLLALTLGVLPAVRVLAEHDERAAAEVAGAVTGRFSRLALIVMLVVATTGTYAALIRVQGLADLTSTAWGKELTVKVLLWGMVLGLAAWNLGRLVPRIADRLGRAGQRLATAGRLGRTIRAELGLAGVLLVVATVLSATIPPGQGTSVASAAAADVRGGPQAHDLMAGSVRLSVALEPGAVGPNTVTVVVADRHGAPMRGPDSIALRVQDEAGRVPPVSLAAARVAPGVYRVTSSAFSVAGPWLIAAAVPTASSAEVTANGRFALSFLPVTSGNSPPDPPDAVLLGAQAGSALVGYTVFSTGQGMVVRVRGGLGIPPQLAPRSLRVLDARRRPLPATTQPCGAGCLEAYTATPARGRHTVVAELPGGTVRFPLPLPLPRSAAERLRRADAMLAASGSYRIDEVLDSGSGALHRTRYALEAPNRARWRLQGPAGTTDTVLIGDDRWTREGTGPWKHEHFTGLGVQFPASNWSPREGNVVSLGPASLGTTPVEVLAFVDQDNGAYHRLWVDRTSRILRERMDAPGHFMDRTYSGYGQPVSIQAPR
jgi:copper transport protein